MLRKPIDGTAIATLTNSHLNDVCRNGPGPERFTTLNGERRHVKTETAQELREATNLGDTPLTVIHRNGAAGRRPPERHRVRRGKLEARSWLAELAIDGERIVADTHEHFTRSVHPEVAPRVLNPEYVHRIALIGKGMHDS
jgi:hypothetical protein